ncbi:hypothetical protein GCM10010249_16810 [Streptomyces roseolilacinus]|uniref:Uncharacterized protein n=1 Tax=Streptomyces roseolilacinus TaxID=66904 RepID=A0A918AXN3_9ACTN|nr:hypothetical protein GCM10010249_16810 [Streptomyces roseolilacinus]
MLCPDGQEGRVGTVVVDLGGRPIERLDDLWGAVAEPRGPPEWFVALSAGTGSGCAPVREAAATREKIEMFTGFDSSTGTERLLPGAMAGTVLRTHRLSGVSGVTADGRTRPRPSGQTDGRGRA